MPPILRKILAGVALIAATALIVAPAPDLRSALLSPERTSWILEHREGLEYTSYAIEILLVLLFGGLVFVSRIGDRIKAEADRYAQSNDATLRQLTQDARTYLDGLVGLTDKWRKGDKIEFSEWRAMLEGLMVLHNMTQNFFNWLRVILWALAKMVPGSVYGVAALILFLIKVFADAALITLAG